MCYKGFPQQIFNINHQVHTYSLRTRTKLFSFLILFSVFKSIQCDIKFSTNQLALQLDEQLNVNLETPTNIKGDIYLVVQHEGILKLNPVNITLDGKNTSYKIGVTGIAAGHSEVTANTINPDINVDGVFMNVTVCKSKIIDILSVITGWLYFLAWSISFYPQIYINYKRRSVVGFNFDYVALNIVGYVLYSIFNLGLYTIPEIKKEYFERYPGGLNPVKVNDIVFAVHGCFATIVIITQCFVYERENQKVSIIARVILGIYALFITVSIILSATDVIKWLDFLYYCSYVKLSVTLIKYIPQAYMNYKRKSTVGWSIGNVLLDFTGGVLSMLQMILDSYNYNDWVSIFGDPTKFGLGLFSVIFDVFFIVQHYVLYKTRKSDGS